MKRNKLNHIAAAVLAAAVAVGTFASVGSTVAAAYDSSDDPVVSLSYLYNVFRTELMEDVAEKINVTVDSRMEGLLTDGYESGTSDTYEVVELKAGDALYAEAPCDIMLRSGSAVCIAPDPRQGIADYTSAYEIYDGDSLTKNHMCLIPRGDGRGIRAVSESVYIMVRGEYQVVQGY